MCAAGMRRTRTVETQGRGVLAHLAPWQLPAMNRSKASRHEYIQAIAAGVSPQVLHHVQQLKDLRGRAEIDLQEYVSAGVRDASCGEVHLGEVALELIERYPPVCVSIELLDHVVNCTRHRHDAQE